MAPDSSDLSHVADDDFQARTEETVDERSRMSFLEHLDELRRRILYSLYALIACCVPAFWYWDRLYGYFINYFHALGGSMIYSQPMAAFMFSLKLSALVGLMVASPFIFSQLWLFVAPGLYAKEKKVVLPFVASSTLLFVGGALFAHQVAFPSMWRFFASYEIPGISYMPNLDLAFSLYVKVLLGLGLIFQMPVLVFFLARVGMITPGFMLRKFKYALLIMIVAAAIITPSGDPVNLAVFAAPMLILYLVSIGIAWLFAKKKPVDD
jgi:sec-independent protein translocase protein TatC